MLLSSPATLPHVVVIQFAVNKMEPPRALVLRDISVTRIWVAVPNASRILTVHRISNVSIKNVAILAPASVELMHNVLLIIMFQIVFALRDIPEIQDQIAMK